MILHDEIKNLVTEWGLREDIIEKDYVLGWVLWGIGTDPVLSATWIFKGGTCLKKCFLETYRFSEDLDFTILPEGPITPEEVGPCIAGVLSRVYAESGIDFSVREPRFTSRASPLSTEGRIYYRGPRQAYTPGSIKLDLTQHEKVVQPPVLRPISHPFSDPLPAPGMVQAYAYEEVFAEKIRAMGERCRPRDLYDIVNLFRRGEFRQYPDLVRGVLGEKCAFKDIAIPSYTSLEASPFRAELESEWANMLGHQLPQLPALESFWDELKELFAWLEGEEMPAELVPMAVGEDVDLAWAPPPTISTWDQGVPIEAIRFAAVNHLCVELGYDGRTRLIEPYSLRRTREGNLILHALRLPDRGHRSYRLDRIQSVRVTDQIFRPVYAIEFSARGPLSAPPTPPRDAEMVPSRRRSSFAAPRARSGIEYVIECPVCSKKFTRSRLDTTLRPHKDEQGWPCHGRAGLMVETRYR